jgi:hypothetical protein
MSHILLANHPGFPNRDGNLRRFFRSDAAFARPELYEYLEVEGERYAIRLPANEVLQQEIEPFLTRPVGRPPKRSIVWHHDFLYQAESGTITRRGPAAEPGRIIWEMSADTDRQRRHDDDHL